MTDEPKWIEGATYVCTVPEELGAVTGLEVKRGRVIARTKSGQTMIVPTNTPKAGDTQ